MVKESKNKLTARKSTLVSKQKGNDRRLLSDLCELVKSAKCRVAVSVNSEIVMLYWQVGKRIKDDVLKNKRAAYGEEIVKKVSDFLSEEFGNGWSLKTVQHCLRSAYTFSEDQIVYAVRWYGEG